MCRRGLRAADTAARLLAVALVCSLVATASVPVSAQADEGSTVADERRCFPPGGHDLTIGAGNPHIDVIVHTSLFTSPAPPSALGLSARGVALDSDLIELRTGALFAETPENASESAIWDSFVILFDYRLSLPMFSDSLDDSTYEPAGGPVSGVETRTC